MPAQRGLPATLFVALVVALAATGAFVSGETRPVTAAVGDRLARTTPAATAHNPDGPPPGHTGGFGEPTCHECHFGSELDSGPGILALDLPDRIDPGATQPITIRLAQPGMLRAGFMLSARTSDGEQAGTLHATDARATVTVADGVAYAHQSLDGSFVKGEETEWVVEWTAVGIVAGDSVYVHVAANAGNDDASPFGDYIYTLAGATRVGTLEK